jgi:hypothetical protein
MRRTANKRVQWNTSWHANRCAPLPPKERKKENGGTKFDRGFYVKGEFLKYVKEIKIINERICRGEPGVDGRITLT